MNAETFEPDERKKVEAKTQTRQARSPGAWDVPLATAVAACILFYAWSVSGERHLTAEGGLGYYLGIVGSVMMLLLLVYPLRKRLRSLRFMGAIPAWFRIHMLFGVIGPALVILHSNFRLGSLNSQVALFSMLTVAGSGYVGRFLYKRIHRGLSGRRRSAAELREEAASHWSALFAADDGIEARLVDFEHRFLGQEKSLIVALWRLIPASLARRRLRRDILAAAPGRPVLRARLQTYLEATRRAQTFFIYERLFALWHLLHLPLFILLIAAALLHVFAVHLY